ncbi:unnamed protein product [Clonostachys rhizophaga]|uniref:Major facilitator superfamily (MFS) profile domain-containing protein n=1 Tax=Clonostachys rhizophaga TaxID=160324 RepID=A0A9N9VIG0_9HYPO|nr:unnamed protein product [Clonostachys rhizophaga]
MAQEKNAAGGSRWLKVFRSSATADAGDDSDQRGGQLPHPPKWSMGMLNDPDTVEVPGSVLLLAQHRNQPLGLKNVHARTSHSSIPVDPPFSPTSPGGSRIPEAQSPGSHTPVASASGSRTPGPEIEPEEKKTTDDGTIILEPQPDDSANDPLNWPAWRRDTALLSLGLYCMIGGGMTPLIAAGFHDVAEEYHVQEETVALTTGLYMMGLGVGSVIFSPTAILWGKRPVYLFSVLIFIGASLWSGFSPSFNSLLVARVFQGIAVSPVECLPSATIAEIFFLHERAYRIGIYTLLLLGGKNLVPLVSAVIINSLGWRWAFFITAAIVAGCGVLLFFFVPETFWDRTPHRKAHKRPNFLRRLSSRHTSHTPVHTPTIVSPVSPTSPPVTHHAPERPGALHVGFAPTSVSEKEEPGNPSSPKGDTAHPKVSQSTAKDAASGDTHEPVSPVEAAPTHETRLRTPLTRPTSAHDAAPIDESGISSPIGSFSPEEKGFAARLRQPPKVQAYTHNLKQQPARSFVQQLKPFHGRLNNDKWLKAMARPFILFAYPAVLWSSIVYACSIGWLIVISESLTMIYGNPDLYNFTSLQTGLVYISPFVGGILGTGVAGKISDVIVKAMSKRNGGMYEPEFRLVMAIPITITTCIGIMGFGWSASLKNHWIVPTLFFGIISFGCCLGSTTSITFCVDSYRQYAGEALVTLNFSKNILHGLLFSLFFTHWLADDGPKMVYIWIGIIQLGLMLLTIPMYIYGKRARMWTVRMNFMERF